MSWHGVEAVDDAIDATREFLFPASLGRWVRIAVVSVFVGGGGQLLGNAGNIAARIAGPAGVPSDPGPASAIAPSFAAPLAAAPAVPALLGSGLSSGASAVVGFAPLQTVTRPGAVGALGLAVAAGVALLVVGSVLLSPLFEFVLVDAIARDDVRLLRDLRTHLVNGLRYLGFRIGLAAAFVVPPAALVAAALLTGASPDRVLESPGVAAALAIAVAVYLLVYVLVARFTREFVVASMVADGGGVVDNWRRVWPLLRGQPWQTLVYLLMHALVGIGVSIVSAVLTLLGLLLVAVVAGVVGLAVGAAVGGGLGTGTGLGAGGVAAAVVGIPLFLLGVLLPVRVLTTTFSRSYEIASLCRFSNALGLISRYRDEPDATEGRDVGDGDEGPDDSGDTGGDDGRDDGGDIDGDDGRDTDDDFGGFVPATDAWETDGEEDRDGRR